MGHDICGYNKARQEIAYARFSLGNSNASILYALLDAYDYHAGVSGSGEIASFSLQEIEKAIEKYKQVFKHDASSQLEPMDWDQKQILQFIQNCLTTARQEGSVSVFFG
ncbi:hypothetical protein PU629_09890 [Pullulanibacillus sp. KACC 23026]|uniref:hypothetical protein n=1 Tax=Pullulanibacillus sp. KACC 23026 TaxID=3028315 RepID=UPI0023B01B75|nr:hypothetical protein [Pullulanibacillus sp. KACC 23026]WEG14644.1 hypothetical protein PU629_09890 [Pullulanibacillus sp. KACC 23026]